MRMTNRFEAAARARKVDALAAAVFRTFTPANAFQAGALAALLVGASRKDRARFAHDAGVTPPSETTWRLVVEMVRERGAAARRAA